jgi:iron complex transport system permease protein
MLGGALLLVSADLLSRLLIEPVEVPVGLVTAAIGGPLFLWLISKKRDG